MKYKENKRKRAYKYRWVKPLRKTDDEYTLKNEPEALAQRRVVSWLRSQGIGCFSVPNESTAPIRYRAKQVAMGMLNGAPDLVLIRRALNGVGPTTNELAPVALEMKRAGAGAKVSDAQAMLHEKLEKEGWVVVVGYGYDETIEKLKKLYGI